VERVVVVGGGVLGTMHALAARRRGLDVLHLEREPEARGASVRNFGLIWVSGRAAGPELSLALRARPDAAIRGYELLEAGEARQVNPALRGEFSGALRCRRDAVVEPRLALPAIREHLLAGSGGGRARYRWRPGREVAEVAPHAVRDHTGEWHRGDLVVLCTGATHTGLAGPHLAGYPQPPVRRVRLQMMQTEPFDGHLTTSVADGDSLRYYPAFDLPGRAGLGPQAPVAAAEAAQLLLVQRADGSLTIGDTHEYAEPFAFDVREDAYDHLRGKAEQLLGGPLPRTQRRWAGVYSQVTGSELYHRSQVAPGVALVTGPGGRGMTCAPAIAEETFA
jgi:glycine/D-amino acid oxidase-like deaminating enzyme